jgi:EmrB/QacA subfamily drug resistance transporter
MNSNVRRWVALVVVCFGQLMIVLDSTIVNVALPSIQHDLNFSQADLTWVVNSYLISYASFLLVAGRFGDLIGRRKVFLAGVLLFTAASAACGLSQGATELVVARFIQGLGASLSSGVIIAIIVTEFQKPIERAQAMSLFTFVIAGGGSLGLLAGGALTQWVNWHWIFFINLPIGVATLVFGAWLIAENRGLGLSHGVDVAGSILITAALMLAVYAIVTAADVGWTSAHTLGFGGAALALMAVFVVLESRLRNPIMPLRILKLRSLTGASMTRAFVFSGMFTNFFVGALYLQHIRGLSAFGTGLAFLPTSLALATLSAGLSARLMVRFGPRNLAITGLIVIGTALFLLSGADAQSSYFPRIFAAYLLFGLGGGLAFMPLLSISMSEVPAADAGLAAGFGNVTMQMGAAIGLAALGAISTALAQSLIAEGWTVPAALTGGYQLAFLLAALCVLAGLVVVIMVIRPGGGTRTRQRVEFDRAEAEAA